MNVERKVTEDMLRPISHRQAQLLLQYLFGERADLRCEAIRNAAEQQWYHADIVQALKELAVLDEAATVRQAAREALGEFETA
jgi:hypothetical protein